MEKNELYDILKNIYKMFPNAGCELKYNNMFELLVAVSLSAQTTDKLVNMVTYNLFEKYSTPLLLSQAFEQDVYEIIKRLGLAKKKSKNIIELSKILVEKFNSTVPNDYENLISLPGVGRKTANVVLCEGFSIPRIAVDTHVERVSKRLGIVDQEASVLDVELKLMSLINVEDYHISHHLLLFFGRYFCLAKKPKCQDCFYFNKCTTNNLKK